MIIQMQIQLVLFRLDTWQLTMFYLFKYVYQ